MFRGRGLRAIVVHQDTMGGAFQVLKLAALHRPEKNPDNQENQDHAQGNKQIENFHVSFYSCVFEPPVSTRRNAFNTTSSELADMPMPAIQGVIYPSAASGMAIIL